MTLSRRITSNIMTRDLTRREQCDIICVVWVLGVLSVMGNASHNLIALCGLRAILRTPEHPDSILARRMALWL